MTTLGEQIKDDWQYIDGVVTVTVTGRSSTGTAVTKAEVKGLKRTYTVNPGGIVQADTGSTRWHLWVSTLDGYSPKPGDTITSGSDSWIIETTALVTLDTRWQCGCSEVRV